MPRGFLKTQLQTLCRHPIAVKIASDVIITIIVVAGSFLFTGCSQKSPSPDEIREKTADATAQLKTNTKAVVDGVREGLSRDKTVNLNTASEEQLSTLPGVTPTRAKRVVAGRPYDDPHDVVTRHILSEQEYKRIKDRIKTE